MDGLTIAVVGTEPDINILESMLAPQRSQIEHIDYAIDAIKILKERQFPAIVTSLRVAPGESHPITDGMIPNYAEIGCYMIRELRNQDSANKKTPIFVNSVVHPSDDRSYPNAEARVLEAGATAYFQTTTAGLKGLALAIRSHLSS